MTDTPCAADDAHLTRSAPRRRGFIGATAAGIAAVSALGAGTVARAASSRKAAASGRKVAIFGGGVAGLSAALELAERGFQVTVYERKALGGKARSFGVPGSASGGGLELPAEHGFRFFPGFYRNLPDTMRRIPFPGNSDGIYGNLRRASTYLGARVGRPNLTIPFPFPWPIPPGTPPFITPESLIDTAVSGLQSLSMIPPNEIAYFVQKGVTFVTSCDERRLGQWDYVSWNDFIKADQMTPEYRTLFADGIIRNLAATKSSLASTNSIGLVGENTLWSVFGEGNDEADPEASVDRVLDGATNDKMIDPWIAHLAALGVQFFKVGWGVTAYEVSGKRITSATIINASGETQSVTADWYLSAVPVEKAIALLNADMLKADPSLESITNLRTDWMNGLVFHLTKRRDVTPGHVNYWDSTWAITSISQAQFWARDFATYGDGKIRDNLSTIISDWNSPGILTSKTAKECTPAEIAAEVWAQIKAHLNKPWEAPFLTDDMLHDWYLDTAITGAGTPDVGNYEPLFIQTTGSWKDRPNSRTSIENFFLAGDWVKTNINVTTMESANEGGRMAANALLDTVGYTGSRATLGKLWINPTFTEAKKVDQYRYSQGLPNIFDADETYPAHPA